MELKPLLEAIVRDLVDKPEEVRISEHARDTATVLELRVARSDIGKVIGKDGRTAQSIRTLLTAAGSKDRRKVHLDIVD
jgi:predicted RNA-binding protein YlqC (UPF0109 family)